MKRKLHTCARFLLFAVVLPLSLLVLALSVYDVRLPHNLSRALCARISNETLLVRCDFVSFGFRRGLVVRGGRAYLRKKTTTTPVAKAEEIDAVLAFHRFPWRLRRLRVVGLQYKRLPDSYYIPASELFPGRPDYQEKDEPLQIEMPVLHPFKLELERPDILGIRPEYVEAAAVSSDARGFRAKGITIEWPDTDVKMHVTGEAELDLVRQEVSGRVVGQARQWHIRPLLETLDIPIALKYIDAFTNVRAPVEAGYLFSVNLRNNDFHMSLDLNPKGGNYNGVPFTEARGNIDITTEIRGTNFNSRVKVGPIVADFEPAGHADGTITFVGSNGVRRVFIEASSTRLALTNALAVADILNDGSLDALQLDTPPTLAIHGVLAVDDQYADLNDLSGSFYFGRGSFFEVPFSDATVELHQHGTVVELPHYRAAMKSGGDVTGSARFDFPGFEREKATFGVACKGKDLLLGDLCEAFKIEHGERKGIVDFDLDIAAPFATNFVSRLNGRARTSCHDGQLSRTHLFMGLTDYLSKNVPGVSSLVDMTQGSATFSITNGVITTTDLAIEGSVFALHAGGSYDLTNDRIEAKARAQFFKRNSLLGKLTHPITEMLMKTLMEFRVHGTLTDPKWQYSTTVTRLGGGK